ncbi:XRE family transcriptional regulator [Geodermatophilus sp. Leaf369]|jgi:transcriptional regulator with XRE-family HTH domain|uniref:helix-turn-helix domain-containing protein n=1 Tax=Geodermatophilus sp. Leaf369 TaxID=1736354 RepID=UPI000700349B|nr:helix-turn-helix transcriptional regulator [Geodermatophilus sp. Leaf369]KQS56931.1 XRE family transcriptional regulator [Geodermatophilus sp. Leaf369]QNG35497.1 helix-turn-helix transcriptional regulator [Geodermatophilaceae bacterium NBWT11]
MVRPPLTPDERARGHRLGAHLRAARGERSLPEVAAASGIGVETLRKIESGRVPTPAFFTVAALARALDLDLDQLAAALDPAPVGALSA